jgi:hypothetical protein
VSGKNKLRESESSEQDNGTTLDDQECLRELATLMPAGSSAIGGPISVHMLKEVEMQKAIGWFSAYLSSEREHHYQNGLPLQGEWREMMDGYFAPALLDQVRIVELTDRRVPNPWFYPHAKDKGVRHLPDMSHKAAVTFLDVVVFNGKINSRDLFHGLVHAAQVELMGLLEFSELFVRGFLRARSYFLVPMKAHAFGLDARFAAQPGVRFSVEKDVFEWWRDGRYGRVRGSVTDGVLDAS